MYENRCFACWCAETSVFAFHFDFARMGGTLWGPHAKATFWNSSRILHIGCGKLNSCGMSFSIYRRFLIRKWLRQCPCRPWQAAKKRLTQKLFRTLRFPNIGLLDERQGRVLRLYYFESYVWTDVAKVMHMTVRTAQRIRQQAVDELEKLYAFAKDFFLI